MSDDEEDDYKNKRKKENNNSENNEEEEEAEEENEEIEEESENNDNKINSNNIKYSNNSKNEKINEEEASKIKNLNDNNNDKKKAAEYIAQIEELENEILLEKNINIKLKDNFNQDEYTKLSTELIQKNLMLEKLISTNKKQKSALSLLTKQLDKENKKRLKLKSQDALRIDNNEDTDRSDKELKKEKAVDIVLKVKDKELSNATNKMNILKYENEGLKKLLFENEDYNKNINMEDKTKEMSDKIEKCNDEKNSLIKQLKFHKKCLEEQKEYNDKYDNLKEELKQIKKNIQDVRKQTFKLINENQNKNGNISSNNNNFLYLGLHSQNSINTNNRYNKGTISTPNIHLNKDKIKNIKKINLSKDKKGIVLPLINSQAISQNESVLTENFKKSIKEYLDNDEDEYITLINKISNLENSRKLIETKHKNELKQFNSQISSLNEQYQLLNCDSKGSNSNIRVLKYKLNTIKGDNKQYSKKLNELKKELLSKINISKEKDYEISILIGQINSLRNLANYTNVEIPQDDISEYIEKLKQEKEADINEKLEEEKKSNKKNENSNNKERSKMEESIQADFPESEDYNNEEEFEEKIIKNGKKLKQKNK